MRITETRMLQLMSGRTMDTQSSIAKASTQVATGVAVDKPSDDPLRWADGMRTQLSMDRRDAHESTVERVRDNLQRTDDALGSIVDALARVKELAQLGSSDSNSAEGRAVVAVEIGELFNSMLSSANVRSVDGEFLLAGTNSSVRPFDAAGVYQGNDIARQVESGDSIYRQANIPGSALTAASGTDVFGTVDAIRVAMQNDDAAGARALIDDLNAAIEQVAYARSDSGVAASSLDRSLDVLSDLELSLTESFEDAVGADPIESATWLANLGNQLEASRLVSERIVSMMSLGG